MSVLYESKDVSIHEIKKVGEKFKMGNELYHWGIKGMKWGVRRYQNKDGSLTDIGHKKKGNKVGQADPDRWVKEDHTRMRKLVDESSGMVNKLKNINDTSMRNRPKTKMDLSSMTDQEMRTQINRALLERQYNDMFAPQKTSKGREYASRVLETAGSVLAVTSSALGIALAIKDLRG